jgi:hypothetical protein
MLAKKVTYRGLFGLPFMAVAVDNFYFIVDDNYEIFGPEYFIYVFPNAVQFAVMFETNDI